jgi:Zn-dependent peptidase ImmA (M78 family)
MEFDATSELALISVNPDVLKWARQERGLSRADAAQRLRIPEHELLGYESGSKPSLSMLRRMSERYPINFVSLLLPEPPSPQKKLTDFRAPSTRRSGGLHRDTLVAIQDVQDAIEAFAELHQEDSDAIQLPRVDEILKGQSAEDAARIQRAKFGLSFDEQRKFSPAGARDEWRRRLEARGILVYIKPMPRDDCRGFSILKHGLAAICVNDREENAGAESFTLFHEYCHLLLRKTGISDESNKNQIERYCNRFAAAFLIPLVELRLSLKSPTKPFDYDDTTVKRLASRFKVSNRAMAYRLEQANLAPKGYYESHTSAWDVPSPRKVDAQIKGMTAVERSAKEFGRTHTRFVLGALKRGLLSKADAHGLLNVPIKSFPHLGAAVG